MKKLKYILLCLLLLSFGAAIIICPERYVNYCFQGFAMWAECVLPSLFPFMVITLILIKTGIAEKAALPLKKVTGIFKLPPAAASCFIMSLCSGYPAGSKILNEFHQSGALSSADVKKLSYLCSTSGPLFIIGSVGYKMFGDKSAGVKILIAHIVAVTVVALVLALFTKKSQTTAARRMPADSNLLYNTFYGAVVSVAVAGGFIAFFCVLSQFFSDFQLLYPLEYVLSPLIGSQAQGVCIGLIEATTGCRALAGTGGISVALAGFLITFGGVSILTQQLGYLKSAGVSVIKFAGVKLLQALLCFLILLIIA